MYFCFPQDKRRVPRCKTERFTRSGHSWCWWIRQSRAGANSIRYPAAFLRSETNEEEPDRRNQTATAHYVRKGNNVRSR